MNAGFFARVLIIALGVTALALSTPAQAAGIQMLPPTDFSGNTCTSASSGLLQWDGSSSIKCVPGVSGDGNGYLGIGTTAPQGNLDVANTSGNPMMYLRDSAGTAGTLKLSNQWGNNYIESGLTTETGSAAPLYFTSMNVGNIWMTIGSTGNVGIGTSSPLAKLHVVAPTVNNNMTGILVEETSSELSSPRIGMVDTSLGSPTAAPAWFIDNLSDNFRIFRQPNIFTAGETFVTVNNTGEVGIGTTAPQGTLDVENSAANATLCLNGSCVEHLLTDATTTIAVLQSFHPGCTGGTNTITAEGAFTAWCTAACNRYCGSLGYKGGLINEYNGGTQAAVCGCF